MNLRKEFETWFLRECGDGNFSRLESGEYADLAVRNYWGVWKGVWAALGEQSPAVPEGWRQALQGCAEHFGMLGHAGCPAAVNARALLSAQQPQTLRQDAPGTVSESQKSPELRYAPPEGWLLVPAAPSDEHLDSIATRHRHDFGLLDESQQENLRWFARQMYEEATGQGFFKIAGVTAPQPAERADKLEELRELVLKPAEQPSGAQGDPVALDDYDPGLINDHGGGDVGWWQDYIRSEVGRANDHWRAQVDVLPTQAAPLRYTSDGALAECPCCGSLDVGGAHDTVSCYGCGLTVTKPAPLQNAHDAWNRRARKSHPAPAQQPAAPQPAEPHPLDWPSDEMVARGAKALHDSLREAGCQCDFDHDLRGTERQQVIAEQVFSSMLEHGQAVSVGDPGRIRDAVDDMGKRNRAGTAQMAGMKVGGAVETEQQPAPDVAALVEVLHEGRRAIGDHHVPDDCYATGPVTGDPFRDLVQCPACSFIAMYDAALAAHHKGGAQS